MTTDISTEIAVVGAGPAGSVAAAYLARGGRKVTVFERELFPRFHIGESLLTNGIPIYLDLGVDLSKHPSFALKKQGALFLDESAGGGLCRFDFSQGLEGTFPYAYQVERAHFDKLLADAAAGFGADVRYQHEVSDWTEDAAGVTLTGSWGTCRAKYLLDASGRWAKTAQKNRSMAQVDGFGRFASFAMFHPVTSPKAKETFAKGDILVIMRDNAWVWTIPLPGDRLSVGLVERKKTDGLNAEETLKKLIADSPALSAILAGAQPITPYRRIADFSFYNTKPSTARTVTVGDAHAFLDPIFSSGVTLAAISSQELAVKVQEAFAADAPLDLDSYHARLKTAYDIFERFIERFYRRTWVRNTFFADNKDERIVREITTILAGNVLRQDNGLQNMMLTAERRGVTLEAPVGDWKSPPAVSANKA